MAKNEEHPIVAQLTIRGKKFPVALRIYGREGPEMSSTFILNGVTAGRYNNEVTADTLSDLYKKGMAATKAATTRISIPVQEVSTRRVGTDKGGYGGKHQRYMRNGTIVGKHGGNGNLLIQWEGRTDVEQHIGYTSRDQLFRPMSEADAERYIDLLNLEEETDREKREIEGRYKWGDIRQAVEVEIEKKMSEEAVSA